MKKAWSPQLLSVLRIIVAFLFIQHGAEKWFAFPAAVMPGGGVAVIGTLPWFAAIIETLGGTLLILGLFTRPAAFIVAGEMAVAYFTGHAWRGFWPTLNMGELAVLYCFIFLFFAAEGGGPWSLDAMLARRRSAAIPVSQINDQ
ncbi:MAG TPA: DoxX family protein [Gemmatimonadales bacterium]|nr:DoxX family protein [Gemmatimonadales bacterium]